MLMGEERFESLDGIIAWMKQRVGKQWSAAASAGEAQETGSAADGQAGQGSKL
jgi:hypothetical protein